MAAMFLLAVNGCNTGPFFQQGSCFSHRDFEANCQFGMVEGDQIVAKLSRQIIARCAAIGDFQVLRD